MAEEIYTNGDEATSTNRSDYCSLTNFSAAYKEVHGYASLLVCLLGSAANMLNIAVLTRREMKTPTNMILTGLAISDLLVMVDYIPYSLIHIVDFHHSEGSDNSGKFTYGSALYILFHANFSQVCHTISIWLTVILAVWRYIAIAHPQRNRVWCQMRRTVIAILSTYIVCSAICVPQYLSYGLKSKWYNNRTIYYVYSDNSINSSLITDINYWIYGFLIKLIPCVLLTVLSSRLVLALIKTKKRQEQLIHSNHLTNNENSSRGNLKKPKKLVDKEKQTDRTTKMLLAVLLLFLITEFPQGILGLLSYKLGNSFYINCYHPLGEVLDILALFNSGINFMIYCSMSRQFRQTFSLLFKPKIFNQWVTYDYEKDMTQITQV